MQFLSDLFSPRFDFAYAHFLVSLDSLKVKYMRTVSLLNVLGTLAYGIAAGLNDVHIDDRE